MLTAPVVRQAGPRSSPLATVSAIAAASLLFTAVLALSGCSKPAGAVNASQAQLPTVTVAAPASAMVQDSLEYTGRIEPSQRVELRSRVSGYLQAVQFKDGQRVNVGDVLFVVDQRPFLAARDRAQAGLAQANARLKLASAQAERATRLQAAGANSAEDLDRINAEFETAKAAALAAEADLRSAELELSFTTIRAPIAGVASDRRVDVGNYVTGGAAQGAVLTTIVVTGTPSTSQATWHRQMCSGASSRSTWDGFNCPRIVQAKRMAVRSSARQLSQGAWGSLPPKR